MATIDLGKIKFNWRGTYAGGTAYVPDDVVYYMDGSVGSSYMCVANTTGNAPSSGGTLHASWEYLAKGQATSPTTTQGDIIVRGASADGRLAIGSAGQTLKVNSSANALEYGSASIVERVYHWYDDTQVCQTGNASGSGTGANVFTYQITAKTANPIYRLDWSFFWGNSGTADSNEVHAIAGVFKHASNTGQSNLAYGFGFKGGTRANATFRSQTHDFCLFDSDAGTTNGSDTNWSAQMNHVSSFGNIATADTGSIGRCGDAGTQSVSAGDTLYLRAWIGSHNDGCYGRTYGQTNHMTKAQIILTEFNSSGQ